MKKLFRTTIKVCALLLLITAQAFSQVTVSGTVTDSDGEALIGANILEAGTSNGTITDIDGSYSLRVANNATLVFSFTGFTSQNIAVSGRTTIDVSLSAGEFLDEVVVTGYGTQKQREVTSSITSVKAEDFNQGAIQDVALLVQGKVAGLNISQVGGDPNGNPEIRLRGVATFGANAEPLVVIDGVIGASLANVDPNDIASIDVLKDGSASAIYGTRASSGVILVTTKKGEVGQSKVEYNLYGTVETIGKTHSNLNAQEFSATALGENRGTDTDWLKEVTRTAFTHVHNVSLSGGTKGSNYRASFNYRDAQGIRNDSGFEQLNGRLSFSQKALNDRLTLDLNFSATQRKSEFGFNEALRYAVLYNPTAPVFASASDPLFNRYGGWYQEVNFDYFNPKAIQDQSTNEGKIKEQIISAKAKYDLTDELSVDASISRQKESEIFGRFYEKTAFWRGEGPNGLAQRNTNDRDFLLVETTAKYNKSLDGGIDLSALLGYSWQQSTAEGFGFSAGDFISDDISFNNAGFALDIGNGIASINSYKNENKIIGFFGRLNLNFDDNFYISASLRRDGSSRFGSENQWGTFPAVSAGVDLTNVADLTGIDNLKLRVGYGVTGANAPEDNLDLLRFGRQGSFFFNGAFVPAIGPSTNANPDLKWEVKKEFNAGVDFAFADYKFTGSVDYYNRTTSDLIFNVPVPVPPNTASRTWANLEDVELKNSGIEIALGYNYSSGDFSWNPSLTFGTFSTSLDQIDSPDAKFQFFQSGGQFFDEQTSPGAPGLNNNPTIVVQANQPLGQFWGPKVTGTTPEGDWIFEDVNGDGVGDNSDRQVIGNGLPDFSLGLNNSFTFGNADVSVFLRGDFGHELINMWRVFYEYSQNPRSSIENIIATDLFDPSVREQPQFNSVHVESASFLSIDNVTVGYTFDLPEASPFSNVRVYLNGRNLAMFTGYSGVDPAVRYADPGSSDNGNTPANIDNPSPLAPGINRRNDYFLTRQFSLGANLAF
jgi:iron complex outermembrane receptor protein